MKKLIVFFVMALIFAPVLLAEKSSIKNNEKDLARLKDAAHLFDNEDYKES